MRLYSGAQVSKSTKYCVYSEYSAKMRVEILCVGGCLFISLFGLGYLTLVPPSINVLYYVNFAQNLNIMYINRSILSYNQSIYAI